MDPKFNMSPNVETNTTTLEEEKKVMNPEQQQKAESMSKEFEDLAKNQPTPEEVENMPEEKKKKYFSKMKLVLTALGLAGITTFAVNYGHLDLSLPETMNASKGAILEGAGLLTTVGSVIGLKLYSIYQQVKAKLA